MNRWEDVPEVGIAAVDIRLVGTPLPAVEALDFDIHAEEHHLALESCSSPVPTSWDLSRRISIERNCYQ